MPPIDSKRDKVELVSGGQMVNGEFRPTEGRVSPPAQVNPISPITPSQLTGEIKPFDIPQQSSTGSASGELARFQSQTDQFTQNLTEQREQREQGFESSFEQYINSQLSTPTETELEASAYSKGRINPLTGKRESVDTIQYELDAINQEMLAEQQALLNTITDLEKNPQGLSGGALEDAIDDARVKSLRNQANLTIKQLGIQGRYDSAKSIADRAVDIQFEKKEQKNKVAETIYNLNKELFTLSEQREFESKQADRTRAIEDEKEETKSIYDTAITAGQNGGSPELVQKILASSNRNEALALATNYLTNPLDRQLKNIQLSNAILQNDKLKLEIEDYRDVRDVMDGQFGQVIKTASGLLAPERGKIAQQNMAESIKNGNYANAYASIANAVEEGLTGDNATKFGAARTDLEVLNNLRSSIQEYADAGGDMGLLVGKEEEIKRKLGIDSGAASELAVQLWREFQTYRVNMTGAAFSPAESADYAAVNPTLGKSLDLNLSVIDGAKKQLENRVTSTVNTRVPGAQEIYDIANSSSEEEYINQVDSALGSSNDILEEYLRGFELPQI